MELHFIEGHALFVGCLWMQVGFYFYMRVSSISMQWSLNGAPLYLATCFIRLSSVNAVRPYDVHRVSWCCCGLWMQFHFNFYMRVSDIFMLWSLNGAPLYLATCFIRLLSVNVACFHYTCVLQTSSRGGLWMELHFFEAHALFVGRLWMQLGYNFYMRATNIFMRWSLNGAPLYLDQSSIPVRAASASLRDP